MWRIKFVSIQVVGLLALGGCKSDPPARDEAKQSAKADEASSEDASSDVVHGEIAEKTSLTPDDTAGIESEAREAVDHIANARNAIAAKHHEKAKKELTAAETALEDIAAKHPTVEITEKLWDERGKIPRTERDEVDEATLAQVPVDATMGRVSLFVRDKPRYHSPSPDEPEKKAGDTPLRVAEDMVMYTEIDLPIATTRLAVLAAKTLAEDAKWDEADELLAQAQGAMNFVVVASEGPLMQLRKHVWQTMAGITGGKPDVAAAELAKAQNLAKELSEDGDTEETVKKELKLIRSELDRLEKAVGTGSADTKDFRHLRERVWALAQRWSARGTVATEDLAIRDPLVDALWRLDLAEDWMIVGDLDEAGGEHLLARAALERAKDEADAATKPVVEGILARLVELDPISERPPGEVLARYSELQAQLREVVFSLDPASLPPKLAQARAH
jgi:hypothetical protein